MLYLNFKDVIMARYKTPAEIENSAWSAAVSVFVITVALISYSAIGYALYAVPYSHFRGVVLIAVLVLGLIVAGILAYYVREFYISQAKKRIKSIDNTCK